MAIENLAIVGSGPAAYTAAIYAARANLKPLLFEGLILSPPGGQLMTTTEVENYPGFPEKILGPELMEKFKKQAEKFETRCLQEDVLKVDLKKEPFELETKAGKYLARAIIIATGAKALRLDVPGAGDGEFWQKGVTACAICDGALPIFRNKGLFVIGGGDSAMEEALFLTKYGKKVYIVHRRDEFKASKILSDRVKKHPKIEILWNHELKEVKGSGFVEKIVLFNNKTQQSVEKEASGIFFAVGHTPNTAFLRGQIELDKTGYIVIKQPGCATNVAGVFAAGDVQDKIYRQAVTAAGSGCMAALDAEKWLSAQGYI